MRRWHQFFSRRKVRQRSRAESGVTRSWFWRECRPGGRDYLFFNRLTIASVSYTHPPQTPPLA
jgi:hypothetical protein